MLLEIIAYNYESAVMATNAGADRLELCADSASGGTTPAFGFIQKCIEELEIPTYPMIRHRGGNFVYANDEKDIMISDVLMCKEIGCAGIVTGALQKDGRIDEGFLEDVMDVAGNMEVTFHRAFDRCIDPINSLEILKKYKVRRLLTSGQKPTALEGLPLLKDLVMHAGNEIIIMPGSGVRPSTLKEIMSCGAMEFHSSSCRKNSQSPGYQPVGMEDHFVVDAVDENAIIEMKRIFRNQQSK